MKQTTLFTLLLLGCCLFCSCEDEESTILELDKTELTLGYQNNFETIKLTSNKKWYVKDVPDWITFDNSPSDEQTRDIYLSIDENNTFEQRSATLIFSNGDITRTLSVTQLSLQEANPFIRFDKQYVDVSVFGGESTIELTTNRPWEINNIPEWLTVNPLSGDKSATIHFKANENRNIKPRDVSLSFSVEGVTRTLSVGQLGLKDIIRGPSLEIFRTKEMGFSGNMTYCDVKTNQLFVNPGITNKIFLGNLVCHNINNGVDIPEFTGYTFKPVAVSTSASDERREWIPSIAAQNQFADDIVSKKPQEAVYFKEDNHAEFYTYRMLHAIGMVNFGVKLDEIVTGDSYAQKEMEDKYGLVFCFRRTAFTLDLDLPQSESIINETLKDTDRIKGVSYVSSVGYGNLGLLVVQSVTDSKGVQTAIHKFLDESVLSSDETALIESAEICYVYFDNNNQAQSEKSPLKALNAYREAKNSTDFGNIYPVDFSVADFTSHNRNALSYKIDIP